MMQTGMPRLGLLETLARTRSPLLGFPSTLQLESFQALPLTLEFQPLKLYAQTQVEPRILKHSRLQLELTILLFTLNLEFKTLLLGKQSVFLYLDHG